MLRLTETEVEFHSFVSGVRSTCPKIHYHSCFAWWFVGVWSLTRCDVRFCIGGDREPTTVDEQTAQKKEKNPNRTEKLSEKKFDIDTLDVFKRDAIWIRLIWHPFHWWRLKSGKTPRRKSIQFPIPSHKICLWPLPLVM